MLIAAWVVEAETVYVYLRDEYPGIREVLLKEIAKVRPPVSTVSPRSNSAAAPALTSAVKSPR